MTLSRELEQRTSPIRVALEAMLPDLTKATRPAWKAAIGDATARFNPDLPASLMGHAVSERVAWQFAGVPGELHGARALLMAGAHRDVVDALVAEVRERCPDTDPDHEARISCLVGMVDQLYRTMDAGHPWYGPFLAATTLDEAATSVPSEWVADVQTTSRAALDAMVSLDGEQPVTRSPAFSGSGSVGGADGDLALGSTLVEVKAVRAGALHKPYLQQVVSYALLDWDDEYEFDHVAMVMARHGVMVRWPLADLVSAASRGVHGLASARATLRVALDARASDI